MPKKTDDGYRVDIRPRGRNGPRFRKVLATQAEALAYERWVMAEHATAEPWERPQVDNRRLSELAQVWYKLHGKNLKSGDGRKKDIDNWISLAGDPMAKDFTAADFTRVRALRLGSLRKRAKGKNNVVEGTTTVTATTANHDLAHIRAMFNELIRMGEWHGSNPVAGVRALKVDEKELQYLEHDQIAELLTELDKSQDSHARITARVCLTTGARWGEAATLKANQIRAGMVHYVSTKSGKNRSVPIAPDLAELVKSNAPLVDGINTFKRALSKTGIKLPKGQLSHVLRHTFASWYVMKGGNIVVLSEILGHESIETTMRYAHLAKGHLNSALSLNPLST